MIFTLRNGLALAFSATVALAVPMQGIAQQQQRGGYYLPPAQFPTFSQTQQPNGGNSALPVIRGLHLQEGMDRAPGTGNQVYDPGEPSLNMGWVRWDKSRFPLKIWISEGEKLPDVPPQVLQQDRVDRVVGMRRDPQSLLRLPSCPGFKSEMCDVIAEGFEQWRDMENEGVIKFGFTDDPAKADIMVFFTNQMLAADGPGGTYVPAVTMGKVFTTQQYVEKSRRGEPTMPIVMEFRPDPDLARLRANATHEFGHALGIKAHSPFRQDIMYVNRMVDTISPADKATLRALYSKPTPYWYF